MNDYIFNELTSYLASHEQNLMLCTTNCLCRIMETIFPRPIFIPRTEKKAPF